MHKDDSLSQREFDCLYWAAKGLTAKETANRLFIAPTTVNFYKQNVLRKLNCSSIAHAVYEAIKQGILVIDVA